MNPNQVIELTFDLIRFRSISGQETEVLDYLWSYFQDKGWNVEKVPGDETRYSILVSFGKPEIIFTSHIDVVPGEDKQFMPEIKDETLYGRGACDAKGVVACMIAAAEQLSKDGYINFGILIVFEEETSGLGARCSAEYLKDREIKYIVNGEPTCGKLALGHKGVVIFDANFSGKKAHSGLPELGEDANSKMIQAASKLYAADFGEDPVLGSSSVNIGLIDAGVAVNVISDRAHFRAMIRIVKDQKEVEEQVKEIVSEFGEVNFVHSIDPVKMITVPEFDTFVAGFCTDVAHLLPLGADALMYGPGDIARAHTDNEYITLAEIDQAIQDYQKIYHSLRKDIDA